MYEFVIGASLPVFNFNNTKEVDIVRGEAHIMQEEGWIIWPKFTPQDNWGSCWTSHLGNNRYGAYVPAGAIIKIAQRDGKFDPGATKVQGEKYPSTKEIRGIRARLNAALAQVEAQAAEWRAQAEAENLRKQEESLGTLQLAKIALQNKGFVVEIVRGHDYCYLEVNIGEKNPLIVFARQGTVYPISVYGAYRPSIEGTRALVRMAVALRDGVSYEEAHQADVNRRFAPVVRLLAKAGVVDSYPHEVKVQPKDDRQCGGTLWVTHRAPILTGLATVDLHAGGGYTVDMGMTQVSARQAAALLQEHLAVRR